MLTNPRDAFRGQSRSPNMVQLDVLGMVCVCVFYSNFVPKMDNGWKTDEAVPYLNSVQYNDVSNSGQPHAETSRTVTECRST